MAWNGSDGVTTPKRVPPKSFGGVSVLRGIVALAVVLAIGVVVFSIVSRDTSNTKEESERTRTKQIAVVAAERMPDVAVQESVVEGGRKAKAKPESRLNEKGRDKYDMRFAENRAAKTNENTTVVQMAKPMFENPTEQLIADLFTTTVGDVPPIIPEIRDQDEASIIMVIDKMHKISDEDDDEAAYAKETVNLAKRELDKFMREGGTANDFLQYYSQVLMDAHEEYQQSRVFIHKSIRDGEPEVTLGVLERVNQRLAEKGIKQIELTPLERQRLGLND